MTKPQKERLSYRELSAFCRQLAMLIDGGLNVSESAEAIKKANANGKNASVYKTLYENVSVCGMLSSALAQDDVWPGYLREMVGVGESAGRLDEVLNSLAEHYEREDRIGRAAYNAVAYPIVLGGMILVIVIVMLKLVMPVFYRVLEDMGLASYGLSGGLFKTGHALGWTVFAVIGICMLAAVSVCVLLKTGVRGKVYGFLIKISPRVREISFLLETSRTSSVISMMLKSGFTPDGALDAAQRVSFSGIVGEKLRIIEKSVEAGASLSEAMKDAALLNDIDLIMLRMAETVGKADNALERIAAGCEESAEEKVESFVSVIEPTLISVLSVVVGAMLLSVMLPMAGILAGVI